MDGSGDDTHKSSNAIRIPTPGWEGGLSHLQSVYLPVIGFMYIRNGNLCHGIHVIEIHVIYIHDMTEIHVFEIPVMEIHFMEIHVMKNHVKGFMSGETCPGDSCHGDACHGDACHGDACHTSCRYVTFISMQSGIPTRREG